MPTSYSVAQNYPNPFNASTVIRYSLPDNARVKIEIFNILGQKVRTLVDEVQTAGYKTVEWNGTNAQNRTVASGVYFYKIDMGGKHSEVKQMTMLK
jgi:flagellar hook assembly protein FlgD